MTAKLGKTQRMSAFTRKIIQVGLSDREGLISDFMEIVRLEQSFFEKHAIRGAAVAHRIFADIEMRVDVEGQVFAMGLGQSGAIGIRDIIATAEREHLFPAGEYLANDLLMNAVGFFERRLEGGVAKIEDAGVWRRREAVQAVSNSVRGFGRTRAAVVAADAFILRAAQENSIRRREIFG